MKVTEEQRLVPEATKKGLGNAKIAVLELLELKISFAPPNHGGWYLNRQSLI